MTTRTKMEIAISDDPAIAYIGPRPPDADDVDDAVVPVDVPCRRCKRKTSPVNGFCSEHCETVWNTIHGCEAETERQRDERRMAEAQAVLDARKAAGPTEPRPAWAPACCWEWRWYDNVWGVARTCHEECPHVHHLHEPDPVWIAEAKG